MSKRASKRAKSQAGTFYHDRVPLEDDFDIIKARTGSLSGSNYLPVDAGKSMWSSSWTLGDEWGPEENNEFALDPDGEQYDAEVEADLVDVMEKLAAPKKKKKRSQVSVRCISLWSVCINFSEILPG